LISKLALRKLRNSKPLDKFLAKVAWSFYICSRVTAPAETAEPIVDLSSRGVSSLTANGVARKWRRNGLKRLNPGPEMVWSRKPRTHKIWYPGARLTVRRLRLTTQK
jgi:hypothetical protein